MFALFWFGVILASLWLLAALLSWHIQGLVLLITSRSQLAVAVYDLIVLPGVVLHELSHVIAAFVLRVPIMRVSLFQFRKRNDLRQGEVVLGHADPLRMSLIGVAPLIVGIGVVVILLHTFMPVGTQVDRSLLSQIGALLGSPRAALGLYLLVAIANTMFPSAADCQSWRVASMVLLFIGGGLLLLGAQSVLPLQFKQTYATLAAQLTTSLRSVVIIDIVCLGAILILEALVGHIRKRRVVYRSIRS